MNREYICAYHSLLETMEQLTDAEFGRLLRVALRYSRDHEVEEIRGREAILWPVLRWQIDRDNAAFEAKCQQYRANGQRGGRPSTRETDRVEKNQTVFSETERPAENQTVFSETEKTHNKDKDKDKDEYDIPPYISPPQGGSTGKPTRKTYSPEFEAFWAAYPGYRATNKARCYELFKRITPDELPAVMASLEAHKKSRQWQDGIIPLAATWLNQRRWESAAPPPGKPQSEGFSWADLAARMDAEEGCT